MATEKIRLPLLERLFAYSLVLNGALGLAFMSVAIVALVGSSAPVSLIGVFLPFAGIACGIFALRGKSIALVIGVAFYAIQSIRYYSSAFSLGFTSGLQFGIAFRPSPNTTVAMNILAIVFMLFGVFVLAEHFGGET